MDDVGIVTSMLNPLMLPQFVLGIVIPALWWPIVHHLAIKSGVGFDDVDAKIAVFLLNFGIWPQSMDGKGLTE